MLVRELYIRVENRALIRFYTRTRTFNAGASSGAAEYAQPAPREPRRRYDEPQDHLNPAYDVPQLGARYDQPLLRDEPRYQTAEDAMRVQTIGAALGPEVGERESNTDDALVSGDPWAYVCWSRACYRRR